MALPVVVTDAIALYGADAAAAAGLVIVAGAVVYGGVMLLQLTEALFAPSGAAGGGSDFSSAAFGSRSDSSDRQADYPDAEELRQINAKEDRKAQEFQAAADEFGGVDGLRSHMDEVDAGYMAMWADMEAQHKANTAEYDRLADVWQGWTDQVETARSSGGVAPYASKSLDLYQRLVDRGMDAQDAIAAVEERNAAAERSWHREQMAEELAFRVGLSPDQIRQREELFDELGRRRSEL